MQNFSYVLGIHYLSKIIGSVHSHINQAGTAKHFKHFSILPNSPTDGDLQHLPRDCSLLRKDEKTELS